MYSENKTIKEIVSHLGGKVLTVSHLSAGVFFFSRNRGDFFIT